MKHPTWSASSLRAGASGVAYTYGFSVSGVLKRVTSVTMTVPAGTTGTPAVGAVSPVSYAGGTVSLSGTTLTYTRDAGTKILNSTTVSIQITGLTNTPTADTYTSTITARSGTTKAGTGTTSAVKFTKLLTVTSPGSLAWTAGLNGSNQAIVDTRPGDQQVTATNTTGTGAGWHITVSATTLTSGTRRLPNSGTLVVTGSLSSINATSPPTASCMTTCTLPTSTTKYPVGITTGASPAPFTVYSAAAGTGTGQVLLGGAGAANPWGWWIRLPGNVFAGSYTTTVTVTAVSGP